MGYLNTLQRHGGDNINATAEANSQNAFAKNILSCDEALVANVLKHLRGGAGSNNVLLTGYAGDGKTTLAEFVHQKLTGNPMASIGAERIVDYDSESDAEVVIIKDLSANDSDEASKLIDDIKGPNALLLVSNTGSVRARLLSMAEAFGISETELKKNVLSGLKGDDSGFEGDIWLGSNLRLHVFNLARHDNLVTAKSVLKKILDHPAWSCSSALRDSVSFVNVQLMKTNDYYAVDRMFELYHRLYAYGERLTMRQFVEHFAYTISGGLQYDKRMGDAKAYFFQNFFGEMMPQNDEMIADRLSDEIRAIQLVSRPAFGCNISSKWKRNLWILGGEDVLDEEYRYCCPAVIRDFFCWLKDTYANNGAKASPVTRAFRLMLMRIHFFLNQIQNDSARVEYVCSFLNSPGLKYLEEARIDDGLSISSRNSLLTIIRDCLRDFFLGIRIPISDEGNSDTLYISMSRNIPEITQTAQIVEGEVSWKMLRPRLEFDSQAYRFNLVVNLDGKWISVLEISLPFLDYLIQCNNGIVDNSSFATFQKRLEAMKIDLINAMPTEDLAIVYLKLDHSVGVKRFEIDSRRMEINMGDRR